MQKALKTLQNPGASAREAVNTWPGTSIPKSTRNAFDLRAGMRPPVETRVCTKCGEEKPITTFKSSGKCGACRDQEQLLRKRHGGAYSKAGAK